ncbi:MAG: hypothetical protein LBV45_10870 [Xanthomonadaceae bacterium]|nr:hypothetical protein [Xanthomonadaceae bacterium]
MAATIESPIIFASSGIGLPMAGRKRSLFGKKRTCYSLGGGEPEPARERFRWAFSLTDSKRIGEENLFDRYPDEPPYAIGGDKLTRRPNFYATIADCEQHGTQHRIYPFMPPADEED